MNTEKFLKSLLTLEEKTTKTREEKKEKTRKQKTFLTLTSIKENNSKWFWISLFGNNTKEKNFLIDYTQKLEKVSRKIKSNIIKDIENGDIKDVETIENIISILTIENKIEKEEIKDALLSIELENELNHFIEWIQGNNTKKALEKNIKTVNNNKKVSIFFLVSNAMKRLKYQEQKSNEKYEDINTNFFGIDESKNKIDIVKDTYNYNYIIETLKQEKERETFYKIYKEQETKKEQYKKEIQENKEKLKEKVKEIEMFLKNGGKQENIKRDDLETIKEIKETIQELERVRNIEKTSENRKIKNIIASWNIEKYL